MMKDYKKLVNWRCGRSEEEKEMGGWAAAINHNPQQQTAALRDSHLQFAHPKP
jgi:hypothetical protein